MFVSHRWQPEIDCFLSWHGFALYHGQEKLLLMTVAWCYKGDDVKLLQKGKIQFLVAIRGSKTSVLKFLILHLYITSVVCICWFSLYFLAFLSRLLLLPLAHPDILASNFISLAIFFRQQTYQTGKQKPELNQLKGLGHKWPTIIIISINLLAFYHKCCSLIGYTTHFLFCCR